MSDTREFLTEPQLAELLGVDPRTLHRWRGSGEGPPFVRIGPRNVRYSRAALDQWIAARTHQHRAAELAKQAA